MTLETAGCVHSLAFIGRTRTATVKLLISLFGSLRSSSAVFARVNAGRRDGVSMDTLEKHSGVVLDDDATIIDWQPAAVAKRRCGVTGRLLCLAAAAAAFVVGVVPQLRYNDVGV